MTASNYHSAMMILLSSTPLANFKAQVILFALEPIEKGSMPVKPRYEHIIRVEM
jgi:hypothetical protein